MTGERGYVLDLAERFSNEVTSTVNFAFDSAALDAGARDTLRQQARGIGQFPEVRVRVHGQADAVASLGATQPLILDGKYAQAVYRGHVESARGRARCAAER